MIIKFIDQIRKWKRDNNEKEINIDELELMAKNIDDKNNIEWEKLIMQKKQSNLNNEKLEHEIKLMKEDKLFHTSGGNSFKLNDIIKITHQEAFNDGINDYEERYFVLCGSDKDGVININKDEYKEIVKAGKQ